MSKKFLISLLHIHFIMIATAFSSVIPLNGVQEGEYGQGIYLISETITIPLGSTMTLDSGVILTFNPYTGIIVKGRLVCFGSEYENVVFTTKKNRKENSITFSQWNGIKIEKGGSIDLNGVSISNAVFGVKANKDCKLAFKKVIFANNGEDLLWGDSSVVINKGSLYSASFNIVSDIKSKLVKPTLDISQGLDVKKDTNSRVKWKLPVRLSLGVIGVTGGVLAVVNQLKYKDYGAAYSSAGNSSSEIRESGNSAMRKRNAFGAIGAVALAGLTITIFF